MPNNLRERNIIQFENYGVSGFVFGSTPRRIEVDNVLGYRSARPRFIQSYNVYVVCTNKINFFAFFIG